MTDERVMILDRLRQIRIAEGDIRQKCNELYADLTKDLEAEKRDLLDQLKLGGCYVPEKRT